MYIFWCFAVPEGTGSNEKAGGSVFWVRQLSCVVSATAQYLPEMHFSVDLCESNKNYWSQNDDSL